MIPPLTERADTCDGCAWWQRVHVVVYGHNGTTQEPSSYGQCKRMPPTAMERGRPKWPETPAGEWCGEFKAKPTPGVAAVAEVDPR